MGKGCDHCGQTGYRGRTAIFEVLPITEKIAEAINHRATARELRDLALEEGMVTLQMAAMQKISEGACRNLAINHLYVLFIFFI